MRLAYLLFLLGMVLIIDHSALAKKKKPHSYPKPASVVLSTIYGMAQLNNELNRLIQTNLSNADISVYVRSMKYGDMLYARNIHQPLTPASTLKIFTAEAALLYLSPEYRFSTQLLTDAKSVKNGILQGNLYIVLSGDPTLTYYDLVDLMLSLKTQQIRAVAGNVYIDNTAYDQRFYGPGWVWKDTNYCYAAPISASIINHNCLAFKVTPSKIPGRAAQVVTSPKYLYPPIKNSVITKAKRVRSCSVRLLSDQNSMITIDGCMPRGKYAWGVSYVIA